MNRKILSGLTATLLFSAIATPQTGNAKPTQAEDPVSEANLKIASNQGTDPAVELTNEVIKVGEQSSQTKPQDAEDTIAKIHSHLVQGRKSATLYVRNIPILTFVGSAKSRPSDVKIGFQAQPVKDSLATSNKSLDAAVSANKLPNQSAESPESTVISSASAPTNSGSLIPQDSSSKEAPDDPVWRASEVAARLNQLTRETIDASKITVQWDSKATGGQPRYLIKLEDSVLATVSQDTFLPDTTRNLEQDALQVANRLRRLLGNAEPLRSVSGKPGRQNQTIALGPIRFQLSGLASWYGPGLHGNPSASGERFDQNALTAAHRTLPFGTQVVVTNLDNGSSVVVRINDRGPFHGNRVIDLSTAAARVLGLIQTGVAPVRLDILDPRTAATGN